MEIERLNHLFWECIHVQHFRSTLSILLQDYTVFKAYIAWHYSRNRSNRNSIKKLHNFAC